MKKKTSILNSARMLNKERVIKISNGITLKIKAGAVPEDPAELMLYDDIGRDPWSGSGITASDFKKALDQVKGRPLNVRINSLGGDVFEGLAIKALLDEWPQETKAKVDGIAASTASFIPMGCDKIEMAKGSQMFIHDAWGICQGNAQDMEKVAEQLDTTSNLIAGMYAERSGKSVEEMRAKMRAETLMNAADAKELGLCDEVSNEDAVRNFTDKEISGMKAKLQRLQAASNSASASAQAGKQKPSEPVMNRTRMLALLKAHGIVPPDSETDEQIAVRVENLFNDKSKGGAAAGTTVAANTTATAVAEGVLTREQVVAIQQQNAELVKFMNENKRQRIAARVEKFIGDDIIPLAQKDAVIDQAMKDEGVLELFAKMPPNQPGSQNLEVATLEIPHDGQVDPKNLKKHFWDLGAGFSGRFLGPQNADKELDNHALLAFSNNARARTRAFRKHRDQLIAMYDGLVGARNTNSIDSNLQRIVLLQEMLEAFVIPIQRLSAFSIVFSNVPLEGLDTVGVPYYPLQTEASQSWVPGTGYTFNDSNSQIRQVRVGGSGVNSGNAAPANTACDRKFQGLQFDSYTLRRQPFFNAAKLNTQNANKLAVDIYADIVGRVITPANYGASILAEPAQAFSSASVATLYGAATGANWPEDNRCLTIDHNWNTALIQDPAYKQYLAAGTTETLRKAKISEAYGFEDIMVVPNLAANYGTNFLTGWINWLYAMLVATSPIMPAPEVRTLLSRYDVITDDKTGISFEYREMANAQLDQAQYVVECSYGAEVGVGTALQRITSQ